MDSCRCVWRLIQKLVNEHTKTKQSKPMTKALIRDGLDEGRKLQAGYFN